MAWLFFLPALYLLLLLFLLLFQDALIFHPQPVFRDPGKLLLASHVIEPVALVTPDQVRLAGWIAHAKGAAAGHPAPLVLYFCGNAEEASRILHLSERFGHWSLLAINYRGYGTSRGRPSAENLKKDALLIYDHAAGRPGVDPRRIVLLGRSLGSGVAVHLASHRSVAGLILVTPFDSLASVAQRLYPLAPIRLLLRHDFDSLALAPAMRAPMLAIVGGQDTLVPPELTQRLVRAWGGPAETLLLPDADHDTPEGFEAYWQGVSAFLDRTPPL